MRRRKTTKLKIGREQKEVQEENDVEEERIWKRTTNTNTHAITKIIPIYI